MIDPIEIYTNADSVYAQLVAAKGLKVNPVYTGTAEEPDRFEITPEDGIFVASPVVDWFHTAEVVSRFIPGMIIVGQSGITVQKGSTTLLRICTPAAYQQGKEVRGILTACFDDTLHYPPTVGGAIRAALGSIKFPPVNKQYREYRALMKGTTPLCYLYCNPSVGIEATLYDMESAFWHFMRRLPALGVSVKGEKLIWHDTNPEALARFRKLLDVLYPYKFYRNAVWGCLLGSMPGHRLNAFCKGENIPLYARSGLAQSIALLVGRTCWELTARASIGQNIVYAATDCVIVTPGVNGDCPPPEIWIENNVPYRVKASGDYDILKMDTYRVGAKQTKPYESGEGVYEEFKARPEMPGRLFYKQWLPDNQLPEEMRETYRVTTESEQWLESLKALDYAKQIDL